MFVIPFFLKSAKIAIHIFFTSVYLTFPQSIDYALTLPERITENTFENITRQKPKILSIYVCSYLNCKKKTFVIHHLNVPAQYNLAVFLFSGGFSHLLVPVTLLLWLLSEGIMAGG